MIRSKRKSVANIHKQYGVYKSYGLVLPNVFFVNYGISKCIRQIVRDKGEVKCAVI